MVTGWRRTSEGGSRRGGDGVHLNSVLVCVLVSVLVFVLEFVLGFVLEFVFGFVLEFVLGFVPFVFVVFLRPEARTRGEGPGSASTLGCDVSLAWP